ncbi:cyclic nucleotide-binding domain-containing protein [Aspergillus neoniger CBS 115656]|uniref:Cyclic nucleotide-binding domain-containing protein n=1 Tax=Aspergillus neoniger (strain CBS 115656) TaxID=1448310 RepID=A0A318YHS3_ASPNB|nr:hypothetical protein BO87DRAFT_387208 [Aspergillus neoniger CBS 115656]PYH33779.1 hypothetical protein BO87DRAFT_387208 [Aspergillus neoniger CBS 115656]
MPCRIGAEHCSQLYSLSNISTRRTSRIHTITSTLFRVRKSFVPGQQSLPSTSYARTEEQAHRLIISQGGIGDNLYIVEKGTFDYYFATALTQQKTALSIGTKHGTAHPGGFFGELALLYNALRAAK